jgi:hypothetical protein
MKRIKSFKIFENKIESVEMECDQVESISYTEFIGTNQFPVEKSERVHKLKFDEI